MRPEDVQYLRPLGMILRQHRQQLGGRHERPSVGAPPVERRMRTHLLDPAVHVQAFFCHEHPGVVLDDLLCGVVEIAAVAREQGHLREAGHAHVKVVSPHRIRHRRVARERAVAQAVLLRRHPVRVDVDPRAQAGAGDPRATRLDPRRALRAGFVGDSREEHPAQRVSAGQGWRKVVSGRIRIVGPHVCRHAREPVCGWFSRKRRSAGRLCTAWPATSPHS